MLLSNAYSFFCRRQTPDGLQMLWLAAYLTGFPPAGLYTLCWTHGQAPDASVYTSFLRKRIFVSFDIAWNCVNALSGLYLISTQFQTKWRRRWMNCVNALSGLYLISTASSTFLMKVNHIIVSMPSRAYTSFLRYPFKNLGFMRFPEPVFAGICQNILTVAHFHAC